MFGLGDGFSLSLEFRLEAPYRSCVVWHVSSVVEVERLCSVFVIVVSFYDFVKWVARGVIACGVLWLLYVVCFSLYLSFS